MKLPPLLERELNASGRPWSLQPRARHIRILIDGYPVTILPHGRPAQKNNSHNLLNTRAAIRRYLRGQST